MLIRGGALYLSEFGYSRQNDRFCVGLLQRFKELAPRSRLELDNETNESLIYVLRRIYASKRQNDNKLELAVRLMNMPGISSQPAAKRYLKELSAKNSKSTWCSAIKRAARAALDEYWYV